MIVSTFQASGCFFSSSNIFSCSSIWSFSLLRLYLVSTMRVVFLLFMFLYFALADSSTDKPLSTENLDIGNDMFNQPSTSDSGILVGSDASITTENLTDQTIPSSPIDPSDLEQSSNQINPDDANSLESIQLASAGKPDSNCAPSDSKSSRKMRRGNFCRQGAHSYEDNPSSREDFICRLPEETLCCLGPVREVLFMMRCIYCKGLPSFD